MSHFSRWFVLGCGSLYDLILVSSSFTHDKGSAILLTYPLGSPANWTCSSLLMGLLCFLLPEPLASLLLLDSGGCSEADLRFLLPGVSVLAPNMVLLVTPGDDMGFTNKNWQPAIQFSLGYSYFLFSLRVITSIHFTWNNFRYCIFCCRCVEQGFPWILWNRTSSNFDSNGEVL